MGGKLFELEINKKTAKIEGVRVVITDREEQHYSRTLAEPNYYKPVTGYMIATFRGKEAIDTYLKYNGITEELAWANISSVFEKHEQFRLTVKDGTTENTLHLGRIATPYTVTKKDNKVTKVTYSIVKEEKNQPKKTYYSFSLPTKAYVNLCKLVKQKGVLVKNGTKIDVDPTFTNVVDENGDIIQEKIEMPTDGAVVNGEVYLGTMNTVQIMGYGGSGGVKFAPTYTGLLKAYLINGNLIKIVAEGECSKTTLSTEEKVPKGKVIFLATDSLLVMY